VQQGPEGFIFGTLFIVEASFPTLLSFGVKEQRRIGRRDYEHSTAHRQRLTGRMKLTLVLSQTTIAFAERTSVLQLSGSLAVASLEVDGSLEKDDDSGAKASCNTLTMQRPGERPWE